MEHERLHKLQQLLQDKEIIMSKYSRRIKVENDRLHRLERIRYFGCYTRRGFALFVARENRVKGFCRLDGLKA